MHSFLLCLLAVLLAAMPAFAGDVIKVIQDDGSVDVIDITPQAPPPEPEAAPAPEELPEVKTQAPLKAQAAKPAPVKKEPAKAAPKKSSAKKAAPKKSAAKKSTDKKVKMPAQETRDPQARKNLGEQGGGYPLSDSPPRERLPGGKITLEDAMAIALPHAPPARGMNAVERVYQGKAVYAVTFKTETGTVDVLVDAFSGAVLLVK